MCVRQIRLSHLLVIGGCSKEQHWPPPPLGSLCGKQLFSRLLLSSSRRWAWEEPIVRVCVCIHTLRMTKKGGQDPRTLDVNKAGSKNIHTRTPPRAPRVRDLLISNFLSTDCCLAASTPEQKENTPHRSDDASFSLSLVIQIITTGIPKMHPQFSPSVVK